MILIRSLRCYDGPQGADLPGQGVLSDFIRFFRFLCQACKVNMAGWLEERGLNSSVVCSESAEVEEGVRKEVRHLVEGRLAYSDYLRS